MKKQSEEYKYFTHCTRCGRQYGHDILEVFSKGLCPICVRRWGKGVGVLSALEESIPRNPKKIKKIKKITPKEEMKYQVRKLRMKEIEESFKRLEEEEKNDTLSHPKGWSI